MDEIYGWIADRHDYDTEVMREKGRDLAWLAWRLILPVSVAVLAFLWGISGQQGPGILGDLWQQIPDWLPSAAYIALWIGIFLALYAVALKRTVARIQAHL